jgi:hypothetical protein
LVEGFRGLDALFVCQCDCEVPRPRGQIWVGILKLIAESGKGGNDKQVVLWVRAYAVWN